MGALVGRTRRLDPGRDVDLLALAGAEGVLWDAPDLTLAGRGVAARVDVDRSTPQAAAGSVHDALGAIQLHAPSGLPAGVGPVALGALPFAPTAPAQVVVPEVVVAQLDGARWATTVLPAPASTDQHEQALEEALDACDAEGGTTGRALAGFTSAEPTAPGGFEVRSSRHPGAWRDSLAAARDELRAGAADKVVLAREVVVTADAPIPVEAVLARLRAAFPVSLRFSVDGFIGASPELLVARSGDEVRCHPMAGTAPRSGDPELDADLAASLAASAKNQVEHRHTIDLVHETLLPYCSYLDEEAEPSIVAMANVQHLATRLEGRLSHPAASVLELVGALHPTPAVCGRPRDAALGIIAAHEALARDRYSGPVGWIDAAGNGAWAVGIRCAQIDGNVARVTAGVGVVADSDPSAELAETRAKMQALLAAIVRP